MIKYHYYIADVFTKHLFSGAQIAVFPNAEGLDDQLMALIARELNLSETVFMFEGADEADQYSMRIFSPVTEITFAGHPVIAAAFVLAICGNIQLSMPITPVIFDQKSGPIQVNISSENGHPTFVQFTRSSAAIIDRFTPPYEELAQFLSLAEAELDHNKYSPRLVSCGFPYLVVPVWNYESVRKARFNFAAWSQSTAPQTAAQEILLFAPKTPYPDSDFQARILGSRIGMHEDPPVGSAMPALCAYLCSFEHTQKGTHVFAVARGEEKNRRSVINIEMDNKRENMLTIRIGGQAVIAAEGYLNIPEQV